MWIGIDTNAVTTEGTYRFTFDYPYGADLLLPNQIAVPKVSDILGYRLTLSEYYMNKISRTVTAVVKIESSRDNPSVSSVGQWTPSIRVQAGTIRAAGSGGANIPLQPTVVVAPIAIIAGVIALLGLGVVAWLSLRSVEKLVESPAVNLFIIALALGMIYAVIRFAFGKGKP